MANNNNNIAVNLASEAAGLPASTAILPLFPSDAKLVKREEFQAIRLALLRLVEQEGAHVNALQLLLYNDDYSTTTTTTTRRQLRLLLDDDYDYYSTTTTLQR
jgi:hypothetical protein